MRRTAAAVRPPRRSGPRPARRRAPGCRTKLPAVVREHDAAVADRPRRYRAAARRRRLGGGPAKTPWRAAPRQRRATFGFTIWDGVPAAGTLTSAYASRSGSPRQSNGTSRPSQNFCVAWASYWKSPPRRPRRPPESPNAPPISFRCSRQNAQPKWRMNITTSGPCSSARAARPRRRRAQAEVREASPGPSADMRWYGSGPDPQAPPSSAAGPDAAAGPRHGTT